jgi:hypothetical protein
VDGGLLGHAWACHQQVVRALTTLEAKFGQGPNKWKGTGAFASECESKLYKLRKRLETLSKRAVAQRTVEEVLRRQLQVDNWATIARYIHFVSQKSYTVALTNA